MNRIIRFRRLFLLGISGCFPFLIQGEPVGRSTAERVARAMLKQTGGEAILPTLLDDEALTLIYQGDDLAGHPSFYVFNSDRQFVMVAGDDRITPVLSYSTDGLFDPDLIPSGLHALLNVYRSEIDSIVRHVHTRSEKIAAEWDFLLHLHGDDPLDEDNASSGPDSQTTNSRGILSTASGITATLRSYTAGDCLIQTQWSQGVSDYNTVLGIPGVSYKHHEGAYNYYCPVIDGSRTLAGDGATSVAQVICYWGRKGLHIGKSFDFAGMPVHIGNIMPLFPLQQEIHLTADLIYQCAEALNTTYAVAGTATSIDNVIPAFQTFDYHARILNRAENEANWNDLLKNEIDEERPVVYAASNTSDEKHFFICDGYDNDDRFHINWGWGGHFNGFYLLSALSDEDAYGSFEFDHYHAAVTEIYPDPVTPAIPVTGVSLHKTALSLPVGKQETLTAVITPDDASNKNLTWTSDNTSVAIVHNNGLIRAIREGTAEIAVATYDGNHTAMCRVTVTPPQTQISVTGITIDPPDATYINIGKTLALSCTIVPADATNQQVDWTSDKPSTATVSNEGLVTAISEGLVTITVTSQDGGLQHSRMFAITYPVATESVTQTGVWASDKIHVTTAHPTRIRVFNILGVLATQTRVPEGTHRISVPRGVYIVLIDNEKPVKVSVK
jgi:uncharacterized protein YjdB